MSLPPTSKCQNCHPLHAGASCTNAPTRWIDPLCSALIMEPSALTFAAWRLRWSTKMVPGSNNPRSTSDPNGTRGSVFFEGVVKRLTSFTLGMSCNRFLAISIYSSSRSIPIKFHPNFRATAPVVPLPKNGSKIVSPTSVDDRITRWSNASGFWVG